jgi:preprotein translocase subunit SecA
MNQQREIIYEYRDRILEGQDISDVARSQIADAIERLCGEYVQGSFQEDWDLDALFTQLEQIYPTSYDVDDIAEGEGREAVVEKLRADVVDAYNEREQELGDELMRALERFMLLQIIDNRWREHLHDMDYLREGIHLRGFAQIDPLVAYKNEGFEMFTELMNNIWDEFARYIFNVEVSVEPEQQAGPQWGAGQSSTATGSLNYAGGHSAQGREAIAAAAGGALAAGVADPEDEETINPLPVVETRRLDENEKIGRNDPCWCGSGKKFKKCHGA